MLRLITHSNTLIDFSNMDEILTLFILVDNISITLNKVAFAFENQRIHFNTLLVPHHNSRQDPPL